MKKLLMVILELSDIFYFQQKECFMIKIEKEKDRIVVLEDVVINYKMFDLRFVEYMFYYF